MHDVTEDSKAIVQTVADVCGMYECSSWNMNFTSMHIADVFYGSVKAKVRDSREFHLHYFNAIESSELRCGQVNGEYCRVV